MRVGRSAFGLLCVVAVLLAVAGVRATRSAGIRRSGEGTGNLLLNPGAEAGASSFKGWDAVTIPGWEVAAGLPTVVRYGTTGVPGTSGGPPHHGRQLFLGGAGGSSQLTQRVGFERVAQRGTRFTLAAWLGGDKSSRASVEVSFLSSSDTVLGEGRIGPVGGTKGSLLRRAMSGSLPRGTTAVEVALDLSTSLTDYDGPDAPQVGYDWAVADDVSLTLTRPIARPPVLRPPTARIPRFDHVFLVYLENEDFRSIIGNTSEAPYLNGLLSKGTLLANFFAEEHPSDGNYLAFAGGSTFGVPLNDPLEENPTYTISARNIGDLLDAAHDSWRGYLQSADGPCDDTVHGYYWDDDLPFLYFKDVRERPRYCAEHIVPLEQLTSDLARTATTPRFSWIGANDCDEMEGCGIAAGDAFWSKVFGEIERSPAWRTESCLAIVTFDEDGYDFEHPAQQVPTILVGSRYVRRGYVSMVRYTHYSLLRTVEAALGLPSLTANDRFATPVNDAFTSR